MSALQRASEAFDQRHSTSREDDPRVTEDQRRRQEELRRIEEEKERKKQQAIEEAARKLDEEMRKKREALAKEADPLNWIAQPAKSPNDLEVTFESQKNTTVDCASPDDPFESSYGRERRSPSLEEIVPEDPPTFKPWTPSESVSTFKPWTFSSESVSTFKPWTSSESVSTFKPWTPRSVSPTFKPRTSSESVSHSNHFRSFSPLP